MTPRQEPGASQRAHPHSELPILSDKDKIDTCKLNQQKVVIRQSFLLCRSSHCRVHRRKAQDARAASVNVMVTAAGSAHEAHALFLSHTAIQRRLLKVSGSTEGHWFCRHLLDDIRAQSKGRASACRQVPDLLCRSN